jgi:hypothetical protein
MQRCFLLLVSDPLAGGVEGLTESSVILTCVIYCSTAREISRGKGAQSTLSVISTGTEQRRRQPRLDGSAWICGIHGTQEEALLHKAHLPAELANRRRRSRTSRWTSPARPHQISANRREVPIPGRPLSEFLG